jgi:hypothetical protein
MQRLTKCGPFERTVVQKLDELRPHLARSALMSARLQLERARIASETLAALGLPAVVLSEQGKVLAANSLIEALTGYVQWRAQDRVSLKDKAADKLLRDAMAAIGATGGSVRSFPVRDTGAEAMMVAHVIPIRLSARDIFVRCAAALVLTPVTMPQAPPVELVQSLFDLTTRRGARRPRSRLRQNRDRHRLRWRRLAPYDPRAIGPRDGKDSKKSSKIDALLCRLESPVTPWESSPSPSWLPSLQASYFCA